MPITISTPPVQTTIGPGLGVQLSSTFIGPFPSDAQWHLDINLQPDFVDPVLLYQQPCTGNNTTLQILADPAWTEVRGGFMAVDTRQLQVEASIRTSSGVIDSGHAQLPWDTTTGLGYQIRALTGQGTGTGGFTEQDRLQLQAIDTSTAANLVAQLPIGTIASVGLSQLVNGPPDQLLRRSETVLLTGEGSLIRPGGGRQVDAYGAVWDFRVVPPGFGFELGPIREYSRRMAQMAMIAGDAQSNEFTFDVLDIHSSFGKARFPVSLHRIDYKIAPGVTLAWTWLVFVVGQ